MKHGAYLVNNARGAIVDQDAVVDALKSGQLGGMSLLIMETAFQPMKTRHHRALPEFERICMPA